MADTAAVRTGPAVVIGAWLLGTVTATAGSMLAVDQLAHGLLGQGTQQLSVSAVNADLADGGTSQAPSPNPQASSTRRPVRDAHSVAADRHGQRSAAPAGSASPTLPSPAAAGTLLLSADGSAMASCQSGNAYLLYWSPDQGFAADDVVRGPAPVASVTFRGGSDGILMRVSCQGSHPVEHLSRSGWDDDGRPDE